MSKKTLTKATCPTLTRSPRKLQSQRCCLPQPLTSSSSSDNRAYAQQSASSKVKEPSKPKTVKKPKFGGSGEEVRLSIISLPRRPLCSCSHRQPTKRASSHPSKYSRTPKAKSMWNWARRNARRFVHSKVGPFLYIRIPSSSTVNEKAKSFSIYASTTAQTAMRSPGKKAFHLPWSNGRPSNKASAPLIHSSRSRARSDSP